MRFTGTGIFRLRMLGCVGFTARKHAKPKLSKPLVKARAGGILVRVNRRGLVYVREPVVELQ